MAILYFMSKYISYGIASYFFGLKKGKKKVIIIANLFLVNALVMAWHSIALPSISSFFFTNSLVLLIFYSIFNPI